MSMEVADESSFGLSVWSGEPGSMDRPHSHDDIELNLATGRLEYLVRGERVNVEAGEVLLFWAAQPHQLVGFEPGARVTWLTIPLRVLLGWRLPAGFVHALLRGEVITTGSRALLFDAAALDCWQEELAQSGFASETAARDIEAHVRRLALADVGSSPGAEAAPADGDHRVAVVARMAAFIAANAGRTLRVDEIAASVHLNPQYAMTLFKKVLGVSIGSYLTTCRIHEAQRLLLTTTEPPAVVAERVGYSSLSQFYDKFRRVTGASPAAYRRGRSDG